MHPWHFHPMAHARFQRGPSRLLWFIFGGLAATWFHHRKDMLPPGETAWGPCHRARAMQQVPPPPPAVEAAPAAPAEKQEANGNGERSETRWRGSWGDRREGAWNGGWNGSWNGSMTNSEWEEQQERFKQMSEKATNTMSDISEATLDSILTTVESLKSKLADHRTKREEQQRILDQQLEEQRRLAQQPRRWV